MKRILVTGGVGNVGNAAVARLVEAGYTVKVISLVPNAELPGAESSVCNILDYAGLRAAVRGCDAIVHLAAIPTPNLAPSQQVFQTNVQGTFNVFRAAEEEGIRRVVQASSINAMGMYYGLKPAPLLYLPLDEEHPVSGTDAYSFSKHLIEEIGEYFWRRAGISSVALRFPYVAPAAGNTFMLDRSKRVKTLVERMQTRPAEEQRAWFDTHWEKFNSWRASGGQEDPGLFEKLRSGSSPLSEGDLWAMITRANFFTMVDERDSAQALQLGLEVDYEGSHALFINDDHNQTGLPTRLLVRLFYPDVQTFKTPLEGTESLVSIARAQRLLGFKVEYPFAH
jgi:NAD(P)-dependent dehydrogenase (short-subunit alcohol dehydrogenase family)